MPVDGPFRAEVSARRLCDSARERYLSYALSTIMSRSLPDVRDGLKPVQPPDSARDAQLRLDPASATRNAPGSSAAWVPPGGDWRSM